jgi:hypothetical protein
LRAARSTLCLMPWLCEPSRVGESGSTPGFRREAVELVRAGIDTRRDVPRGHRHRFPFRERRPAGPATGSYKSLLAETVHGGVAAGEASPCQSDAIKHALLTNDTTYQFWTLSALGR